MKLFKYKELQAIINCARQLRYAFPYVALLTLGFIDPVFAEKYTERKEPSPCAYVKEAEKAVTEIRGHGFKHSVGCNVRTEKQIEKYVRTLIRRDYSMQRIANEGILFEILGIINDATQYENILVQLYKQQLAGLYDPISKSFSILEGIPQNYIHGMAVHELTHALQDQYYDLNAFVDPKIYTSDEIQARMAVVEGEASIVALDYEKKRNNLPALSDTQWDSTLQAEVGPEMDMFLGSQYPEVLQYLVISPYRTGMRFYHHELRAGGYRSIDHLFNKPPRSTEEVLHPQKYNQEKPDFRIPSIQEIKIASNREDAEVIYDDVLGEFGIRALLTALLNDGARAKIIAEGWGGDRAALFNPKHKNNYELVWETLWDTETDAIEFYHGLQTIFGESNLFPGWVVWKSKIGVRVQKIESKVLVEYKEVL